MICCKSRHPFVVQTLPEGLVTPNLLSYNTALDSMAKSLQWLISLSLFRALHLQSLVPDIISYSVFVAEGFSISGDIQFGFRVCPFETSDIWLIWLIFAPHCWLNWMDQTSSKRAKCSNMCVTSWDSLGDIKSSGQSSVVDACLISWNTALNIFGKMASSALQADLEAQSNVRCLDVLLRIWGGSLQSGAKW